MRFYRSQPCDYNRQCQHPSKLAIPAVHLGASNEWGKGKGIVVVEADLTHHFLDFEV